MLAIHPSLSVLTDKNAPKPSIFLRFDFKGASRLGRLHIFEFPTSENSPKVTYFHTVDFQRRFTLLRPALNCTFHTCSENGGYGTFDFQIWSRHSGMHSETLVVLALWLPHVLRATAACTFSKLHHPKELEPVNFLSMLTSKRASRLLGGTLRSGNLSTKWLRTRRFAYLSGHPGHTNNWKT